MPALFWGFLAIVIVVLGLALIALRSQAQVSDRPGDKGRVRAACGGPPMPAAAIAVTAAATDLPG